MFQDKLFVESMLRNTEGSNLVNTKYDIELKKYIDNYCNNDDNLIVGIDYDIMMFNIYNYLSFIDGVKNGISYDNVELIVKRLLEESKIPISIGKLIVNDEESNVLILKT